MTNLKTPITYYGGKQTLLRYILPLIPVHITYTETFVGGASVYFAKEPAGLEVINDVNGTLINFYKVLKSKYPELKIRIDQTLHSRREHEYAHIVYEFPDFFEPIERAWSLWVLSKMSFASKLDGSFGYDKGKNSVAKKVQNAKDQFTEELSKRLFKLRLSARMHFALFEAVILKTPFTLSILPILGLIVATIRVLII